MIADHSITNPNQLIGKIWKCPFCHEAVEITALGISHTGYKHMAVFSLDDLFEFQLAVNAFEKKEHEILTRWLYESEKQNISPTNKGV